jgi:hypothetical protein
VGGRRHRQKALARSQLGVHQGLYPGRRLCVQRPPAPVAMNTSFIPARRDTLTRTHNASVYPSLQTRVHTEREGTALSSTRRENRLAKLHSHLSHSLRGSRALDVRTWAESSVLARACEGGDGCGPCGVNRNETAVVAEATPYQPCQPRIH